MLNDVFYDEILKDFYWLLERVHDSHKEDRVEWLLYKIF